MQAIKNLPIQSLTVQLTLSEYQQLTSTNNVCSGRESHDKYGYPHHFEFEAGHNARNSS